VSAGSEHSCWLQTNGTLHCWGSNFGAPPPGSPRVRSFRGTAERVGSGLANGKVTLSGKIQSLPRPICGSRFSRGTGCCLKRPVARSWWGDLGAWACCR
jgi:hypothetical protein